MLQKALFCFGPINIYYYSNKHLSFQNVIQIMDKTTKSTLQYSSLYGAKKYETYSYLPKKKQVTRVCQVIKSLIEGWGA